MLSARTTGLPSPLAPISAAITTIDSDSMMHWVSPAMIEGSAAGSSTFHKSWRFVAPNASPASISCFGTVVRPRWVRRIGAGDGEDHRGDEARREPEAEQDERRYEIDEGRQRLHQVEHRPQAAGTAIRRCAAAMPSGTPIAIETVVAPITSARVSTVSFHRP